MAKKKRRKLRGWVYIALSSLLCLCIGFGIFLIKQKTSKSSYRFYNGDVIEVEMSLSADGYLYTYNQQYFTLDDKTYISLNDLYNVYIHVDNGQVELDQKKNTMRFKNNITSIVLDYKKEYMSFSDCTWNEVTAQYLASLSVTNELNLKDTSTHAYIYEGEVYLAQDLCEKILLNSSYQLDLTQNAWNKN